MRFVLALVALCLSGPALAADWDSYLNARFGYVAGIPPGFVAGGESANGDGQVFRSRDGTQTLTIWGGYLAGGDFSAEIAERQASDAASGWAISYQSSSPRWISYSGTRNGLILYARGIARCEDQYAMFRLEYPKSEAVRIDPVVGKLVQMLKAGRC